MTVLRKGSTEKYVANWAAAFGEKKTPKATQPASKKSSRKPPTGDKKNANVKR